MTLRVPLLVSSAALNAALLAAFVLKPVLAPPSLRSLLPHGTAVADDSASRRLEAKRAAVDAERAAARAAGEKARLWSTLHSTDLATLVAQLRAAGFPASVIRAIVDAEVESRFAPRIKALTQSMQDTPYWKPDATFYTGTSKVFETLNQIYRERARLLRSVLGQDAFAWGGTIDPSVVQRRQYGNLSQAKIDLVQRINDDYAEMTGQIRTAMQGITLPEDREKLALLEREKHADLAAILTPEELSDYEMRSSMLLNRMRTTLTIMDASEAEFRTLYQAQLPYNDIINPTSGMMTMEMSEQRREAITKANEAIRAALGDERFAQYLRASNSEFQQLYRLGQRENLNYDTMARAFDLRAPAAEASMKIYNNAQLSADDKRVALKTLADTTRAQLLSTLGPTAGPSYADAARWLTYIQQGGAVTITSDGNVTYRRVPTPPPPGTLPKN